jgi:hypothetical protein
MNEKVYQTVTILLTAVGIVIIAFVYSSQPRSLVEVANKTQVAVGVYSIDAREFEAGKAAFARDDHTAARAAFERSDPERRDALVQFYIAYSFYREGWGRLTNDDKLFAEGLAAAQRSESIDRDLRVTNDPGLKMTTAAEIRRELDEGLKITASDLNPLRLFRERK